MSDGRKIVLGRGQNNEAHPREAAVGSRFTVLQLPDIRSKIPRTAGVTIGNIPPNKANVGLRQYELALAHRLPAGPANDKPPGVFSSLTGIDPKTKSKWTLRNSFFLAGKLDDSIDFEGFAPVQGFISVQKGGGTSVRYYNTDGEVICHGDYLIWDIVDFDDPIKREKQYQVLNGLSSGNDHLPKGSVPVLIKKLDAVQFREFPVHCMEIFAENYEKFLLETHNPRTGFVKDEMANMKDVEVRYIVHALINPVANLLFQLSKHLPGFVIPTYGNGVKSLARLICQTNAGLCLKPKSKALLGVMNGSASENTFSLNASKLQMDAQYDAMQDIWGRCFGMALNVAHPKDLVKILLRP